jgi:hypothetical protein
MATTSFIINEFTGSDAQVRITLTDVGVDTVQVKLEVVSGYIADLVGFFANFDGLTVNNNFTITPIASGPGPALGLDTIAPIVPGTGTLFLDDSGSTTDDSEALNNNVNLNGDGDQRTYNLGVQIGVGGLGQGDDYQTVTFNLTAAGLDVGDFAKVGVRLQAVSVNGVRSGSSKLEGEVPDTTLFSISGTKYLDKTGDGITGDDAGLGGVTIFIDKDGSGTLTAGDLETTTGADGTWSFANLGADAVNKKVLEALPNGYAQTVGTSGYTLNGTNQTDLNFANFKLFNISGTKYLDKTGNGITGDDTGLGGVTIFIDKDGSGTLTAGDLETTTGADGTWSFSDLGADSLNKKVLEALPSGYVQTVGAEGYTLPSEGGQNLSDLNFANFKLFNISGTKFRDVTANGITSDDTTLAGVTIFIDKDGSGTLTAGDASTVTGSGGTWSFSNLGTDAVGKKVLEVVPSGEIQTVGGYTLTGADQDGLNFANYRPEGPGVGTQGFWGQWAAVWDGNTSNDGTFSTKANFAKADVLYRVTDPVTGLQTDANSGTNSANRGILIGDFNRDGLTNGNEKTIFYTVAEARAILASSGSIDGQDSRYSMAKQLIASWLDVIAGNSYDTGIGSIKQDITNAIVWLQNATPAETGAGAGGQDAIGDGSLTVNAAAFRLPSSNSRWSTPLGNPSSGSGRFYGSQIKDVLDYYNNTGAGFALDRDTNAIGGSLATLSSLQAYRSNF